MESADLLLTLVTGAESLRQFLSSAEADEHDHVDDPERLRISMPSRYRRDLQPRVPERPEINQRSALLLCRLVLAVDQVRVATTAQVVMCNLIVAAFPAVTWGLSRHTNWDQDADGRSMRAFPQPKRSPCTKACWSALHGVVLFLSLAYISCTYTCSPVRLSEHVHEHK